jgi:hypothetical protein
VNKISFDPRIHQENSNPRCPICASPADVYKRKADPTDVFEGWCETCGGNVRITESGSRELTSTDEHAIFAGWMRRQTPEVRSSVIRKEDVVQVLRDHPRYSVLEKLDLTLLELAKMASVPGNQVHFRVIGTSQWRMRQMPQRRPFM